MDVIYALGYLVASTLFIFGLKFLGSPRTAVKGNQLGSCGMLLAVVITLLRLGLGPAGFSGLPLVITGLVIGGLIGGVMAKRVEMTGMPEMVGLFNGFGGGASALVALAEAARLDWSGTAASLGRNVWVIGIGHEVKLIKKVFLNKKIIHFSLLIINL